jgi:hypothetical protein
MEASWRLLLLMIEAVMAALLGDRAYVGAASFPETPYNVE